MREIRFDEAKNKVFNADNDKKGIGTLSEKTLHAILKNYIEPNEDKHEIKVEGYVADILNEDGIIEIQTSQFNKMRGKLSKFLPLYPVTIVYPIPSTKWLIWIDEESGENTKKRKSPKKGNPNLIFHELYKIKDHLLNENLRIKIILIDIEEYRLLNGWSFDKKRGSQRYDRIPKKIVEEIDISRPLDYDNLIPLDLPGTFSSKDYSKYTGLSIKKAQTALRMLFYTNTIKKVGKSGNLILYAKNPSQ